MSTNVSARRHPGQDWEAVSPGVWRLKQDADVDLGVYFERVDRRTQERRAIKAERQGFRRAWKKALGR